MGHFYWLKMLFLKEGVFKKHFGVKETGWLQPGSILIKRYFFKKFYLFLVKIALFDVIDSLVLKTAEFHTKKGAKDDSKRQISRTFRDTWQHSLKLQCFLLSLGSIEQ